MTSLLRFAKRYMLPFLPWFLGGSLALFATNWLSVTIPMYLAEAIDALRDLEDPTAIVGRNAAIIAAMGAAIIVIRTASRLLFFTPGRLVEAQVKKDLFARLLEQQPAFLSQWPTGDLMSRASSDVNFLRLLSGFGALTAVNIVAVIGLTLIQMIRLSPALTLYMVVPVAIGLVFTQFFIRRMFRLVRRMQAELADLSDHVLSTYQGVATVHGFVAERAFVERFDDLNEAYLDTSKKRAEMRAAIAPTLGLAASVNVFLLLFVGGPMAIRGEVTVGELVAFTTLVAFLTGPLRGMSFLLSMIKQAQAALERIEAVMAPEPERPDLPDPEPAPSAPPAITVRDLHFTYPDDDEEVLHGIDLEIGPGRTLGILGPTGGGKTTLLRCLARLFNPPRGTVFLDGVDILDIDLDDWRRKLAYVPQRAFLFSESLKENVLLGAPEDGRLERVLELAAMDDDIEALPAGQDTLVGESGLMLSGGQRQRTALARGLVREHVVLVLDDVLSAVDHETERQLIEAIREAGVSPTTLIVSHRISALQHADLIVVLRDGHLVQKGTHGDLIEQEGLYRTTWERQQEGGEA